MGVGLGFAIAACVVHPEKKVVAIEGDSAFGFSGMEIEVPPACPLFVMRLADRGRRPCADTG